MVGQFLVLVSLALIGSAPSFADEGGARSSNVMFWSPSLSFHDMRYILLTSDRPTSVYSDGIERPPPTKDGIELKTDKHLCRLDAPHDHYNEGNFTAYVVGTRWDVNTNFQQCLYDGRQFYNIDLLVQYLNLFPIGKSIKRDRFSTRDTNNGLLITFLRLCSPIEKTYECHFIPKEYHWGSKQHCPLILRYGREGSLCRMIASRLEAAGVGANILDMTLAIASKNITWSYDD